MPSSNRNRAENATDAPERPSRDTATFEPYYWEAYNEIVNPRRFDWYLINKWLPDLGQTGFTIVKVLRDRCYNNRETGVLRDSCEMTMAELAQAVGCSRAFLFKQFGENQALKLFVRRIRQRQMVDGLPRQAENRYQVSMDDPIHPDDYERYDLLRAEKEADRELPETVWKEAKTYESTGKTQGGGEGRTESPGKTHRQSTTATPTESTAWTPNDKLPSGGLDTKESNTPGGGSVPPINPPKGKGEDAEPNPELMKAFKSLLGDAAVTPLSWNNETANSTLEGENGITAIMQHPTPKDGLVGVEPAPRTEAERLGEVWSSVLEEMKEKVNTPTYNTHIRLLSLVSITDSTDHADTKSRPSGEVGVDRPKTAVLLAPSEFTRSWIEKRFTGALEAAFSEVLGQRVGVEVKGVG